MRKIFFLLWLVCVAGFSQNGKYPMGARQSAMGGASVALTDQWALFNNVGALGWLTEDYVFSSYQNRFGLSELSVVGAGYVQRFNKTTAGVGAYKFGDDLFSEQRLHVAVAHQLDMVSLGVSVDYLQYNISTVGTRGVMVVEFGGLANITKQLSVGAHVFNVNQARLVEGTEERVPTVMKAGIAYRPIDDLTINLETEKDLDFTEVFKAGLEYRIVEKVYLRTGFRTAPFNGAFGVGFHPKRFRFDYAFGNDTNLGATHEISAGFQIRKK